MDLRELKALAPADAIKVAAEFAGVSPTVLDGIWNAETRRGTHPTMIGPQTKWGTAKGHFQFLDSTHAEWEKRLGTKLDRMDFHDALYVAAHQAKENMARFGDERAVAAAHHGGPNKKQWGPKTKAYVEQVMGTTGTVTVKPVQPVAPVQVADIKPLVPEKVHPALTAPLLKPVAESVNVLQATAVPVAAAAEAAEVQKGRDQEFWGFGRETTLGASLNKMMTPTWDFIESVRGRQDHTVDYNFTRKLAEEWETRFSGFSMEEQEVLADAVNEKDWNHKVFRIQEKRADDLVKQRAGTMSSLGADLMAGVLDPTTWVTGVGAAAAFGAAGVGAVALARAGRPLAAAAASAGENVVGNVAYEAVQQAFGEHRSVNDYAIGAAVGLLPSVITSPLAYRSGTAALLEKVKADALIKRIEVANQAAKNLGPNATAEQYAKEMARIEAERIAQGRATATGTVPKADQIPAINIDEIEPETPAVNVDLKAPGPGERDIIQESVALRVAKTPDFHTKYSPTFTMENLMKAPPGASLAPGLETDPKWVALRDTTNQLIKQFLPPDTAIILAKGVPEIMPTGTKAIPNGVHLPVATGRSIVGLRNPDLVQTMVHEIGHMIERSYLTKMPAEVQAGVKQAFAEWSKLYKSRAGKGTGAKPALLKRGTLGSFENAGTHIKVGEQRSMEEILTQLPTGGQGYADYFGGFGEFMAEQFNKYIEAGALGQGPAASAALGEAIVKAVKDLFARLKDLFDFAKANNMLRADTRVEDFFEAVRGQAAVSNAVEAAADAEPSFAMQVAGTTVPGATSSGVMGPATPRILAGDLALAHKYGLDLMPQSTPRERAEYKQMVAIYKQAEAWVEANPRDDAKVRVLGNNSLINVALPATLLAASDNPVARMMAGTLLEQSTGAQGRRVTAAISKYMLEQGYIGSSLREYDNFYRAWRNEVGGGAVRDHFDPTNRNAFNRAVASEQDSRLWGHKTNPHPMVARAADAMEAAYEKMRVDQINTKTVGWARLPESSKGYMPHVVSAARLQEATSDELRIFTSVLKEQFENIEGMDDVFAGELARKYLDHARVNANGGHEIPANIHNPAAADMVRGALEAMGMSKDEVAAAMGRYSAGGPSYTKRRLHLDLNRGYDLGGGKSMTLLDLFNTDQVSLMRTQARRVSGEVALAQHGVMGSQGLTLLRRALTFGGDTARADLRQIEAFDQVSAEMLGRPFGSATGKWMDRALTANATARLGGMGFNQLGETVNAIWHVGVMHTLDFVKSVPRLRAEISAMARGEKVPNGILNSLEQYGGGGEFGMEGYKMVTAFDSPENAYQSYGHEAVTWVDRLLRTASHVQGSLSLHRMIHAVQVRGMAEQVTLRAVRYLRDGIETQALKDMGFNADMQARLRKDLPNMVTYDAAGRVATFDITKATDGQAATAFLQAVRRGAGQIIQQTFVGEQGKWAHDGMLKMLTQFKSYPLVAMEKQWARQRGNYGVAGALGILMGSLSIAMPIYYARVALNAMNRPDREEYLERALDPYTVMRASMNYTSVAGMMPELMDLLSNSTGLGPVTGGRTGANQSLVTNLVPGVGYIDDVYQAAINPSDPHKLAQVAPWSRTPLLIPLVNALRDDD